MNHFLFLNIESLKGNYQPKIYKSVNLNIQSMWVSILQNGRKKDKQTSIDKINQFLKLTQKSSFSSAMTKSTVLTTNRPEDRRDYTKEKQNQTMISSRMSYKLKPNSSTGNILANKSNILVGSYLSNIQDGEQGKRAIFKTTAQQNYTLFKQTKSYDVSMDEKNLQQNKEKSDKKTAYFFKILTKKNKLRSEFNINIHNSIFTFKQFIRSCQFASPKPVDPRLPIQNQNRKTIVFDMDETLIHTNQTATANYEIKVPFRSFQGRVGYGFVEVRPHCKQILKRLSQHFDIIIFTASTQSYADPILDHIDPNRVCQHRLYRQSCSLIKNQIFVKDLRVLGRKLSNIVLVDNAPYSYLMQLDNGIPIMPYYRGKDDEQLLVLQEYLMKLKDVQDVRTINRQYFKLHQYVKYDSHQKLISKLYSQWVTR